MIAGLGSIGSRHLRHLVDLGQKDILLYRTKLGTMPENDLGSFPMETDLATALAWQPDAVIISNPTALHMDVAIPAAKAGAHLLIEKPISHNLDQVAQLQRITDQNNIRVLVGYQFRHHPGLKLIFDLLSRAEIGKVLSVRAHWGEYLPGWHPWEDHRQGYSARKDLGGGVILTLSHPLDYLRWLLGEVQQLSAMTASEGELEIDVEDTAEISMRFASGALGSLHLNYNQRPPQHQLEIIGTLGTLRWEQAAGSVEIYRARDENWEKIPWAQDFERDDMFQDQMQHFVDVVSGKAEPTCNLEDGIKALELGLAALKSSSERLTVELSEFRKERNGII